MAIYNSGLLRPPPRRGPRNDSENMSWEQLYNFFGIKDFIYFISSPQIQALLLPVKLVFIFFTFFFLAAVIYFMVNSSWLQYKFLEDVTEFFSWQAYGSREINRQWRKIQKRAEGGTENELKLALIEADDFLNKTMEDMGYSGKTFEEMLENAGKIMLPNYAEISEAHNLRNSIVYDPDYKINTESAKKYLAIYESTIKNIGAS